MITAGIKPKELVDLGLYENEQHVIEEGIRHILRQNPEYKIEIAIERYKDDAVSFEKAAGIAGVSMEEMKETLRSRGVALKGPEYKEEINDDAERARRALR
jgi:predicted HTH domain antitoxin